MIVLLGVERSVLEKLLQHAVAAARLVGHLDDGVPVTGQLGDHVDAIAHELTELLAEHHPGVLPVLIARLLDDDEATEVRRTFSLRSRGGR